MASQISARYTCEICVQTRSVQFDLNEVEDQIYVPENGSNGLFVYSDIHRCNQGILGINNLHIDKNSHVRSFEHLTLPSEKSKRSVIAGLPSPNLPKENYKKVRVTGLKSTNEFRLVLLDQDLKLHLIIGNVKNYEETQFNLISNKNGIFLSYYESAVSTNDYIKKWFQELINHLELLPPTKIGLFIETLRYISTLIKIPPAKFHINMLRTMLSSNQISFSITTNVDDYKKTLEDNVELYGTETVDLMIGLMAFIDSNQASTLQKVSEKFNFEISHLIYTFLLLEQEGLLIINRPEELIIE